VKHSLLAPAALGLVAALGGVSCLGPPLTLPLPEAATGQAAGGEAPARSARPARAFAVTRAADLLDGPAADGRVGDYRLDNEVVAIIVSAPAHALGFAESGGNVIDVAPAGGRDALQQVYGYLGDNFPRQPVYDRVDVAERGGTAVVVARGHDSDEPTLGIETEYALAPGARALRLTSTLTNEGKKPLGKLAIGDAVEWGRSEHFVPEKGFAAVGHFPVDAGWVAGIGEETAYAYVIAEGPLDGRFGWAWSDFNDQIVDLPPGASVKVTRWLVVAAPADARLYEEIAQLRKSRWARLSGRILEEATGDKLAGARVFFDDKDGPLAVTRSTAQGYEVFLPSGEYRIRAEGIGRSGPEQLEVTVGEAMGGATHDVIMSRKGSLVFTVEDAGSPLPARLTVNGIAPTRDPRFGPAFAAPGENLVVSASGAGEVALPPGRYRVIASRGPEYGLDEQRIEVPDGGSVRATFKLHREVDALGWRCVDLHQHASPSSDSAVSLVDRAASNLAEGLEVIVATDHNSVAADWKAAIGALHITRPLSVIVGDEVSLERYGHFTVIPFVPQPNLARGGAPEVRGKVPGELVRSLKAPDRVVILNHPRAGGRTGYFENVQLDEHGNIPKEVQALDAVEIFTGKDSTRVEPALRDWLSLLDRGFILTAVGGSDSHLIAGQEVGWPRTCIADGDGPIDADALVTALKKKREALVTNGPFVRVSVAGHGMGQLAPAPRGRAKVDIEVAAAPWIDVRRLELFVNGSRRGKPIEIPPSQKPVRYKGSIDLRIDRDAYVVVVVRGDAPFGAVLPPSPGMSPPTPLAVTNPVYLDRDGDGRWVAPNAPVKTPNVK
jgi:predicted metal-dependent phosphoesterase TrpH